MCDCCGNNAEKNLQVEKVGNVNCGGCLSKVEKSLANIPGILTIEHLQESKEAKITFDNRIANKERLAEALSNIGYNFL